MNAHAFTLASVINTRPIQIIPGPEVMWEALMRLTAKSGLFTIADAAHAAGTTIGAMDEYVSRLRRADAVTYEGFTNDNVKLFALRKRRHLPFVVNSKGEPSRPHQMMEKMWRTMKMTKAFSLRELIQFSTIPGLVIKESTAQTFVDALADAGYLRRSVNPKSGEEKFSLMPGMVTGPLPPRICRAFLVYDPNRRAIMTETLIAEEVQI